VSPDELSYPQNRTPEQAALVQRWLDSVLYKPGFTMTALYMFEMADIRVQVMALLFDSTRPEQVRLIRNHSVRVAVPMQHDRKELWGPEVAPHVPMYDAGPDLMSGPLVTIGRLDYLPGYLLIPAESTEPAVLKQARLTFLGWLRDWLGELEFHERDEWLRDAITGRPLHDPHEQPYRPGGPL
jgi:hypothetical protein